jgi:hypothetical protein
VDVRNESQRRLRACREQIAAETARLVPHSTFCDAIERELQDVLEGLDEVDLLLGHELELTGNGGKR